MASLTLSPLLSDLTAISEQIVPQQSLATLRPNQVSHLAQRFQALQDRLWSELPYGVIEPHQHAVAKHLIDLHHQSYDLVEHYHADANRFVYECCVANVIVDDDGSRQARDAMAKQVNQLFAKYRLPPIGVSDVVVADLGGREITVVHRQLQQALSSVLHDFLVSFFQTLARMYHDQLLGSIAWIDQDTCKFSFGQHELTHTGSTREHTWEVGHVDDPDFDRWGIDETEVSDATGFFEGEAWEERHHYKCIHWYIEHHLTRASSESRLGLPHESPRRIARLWDATPPWLKQELSVVRGTLIKKHVYEKNKTELDVAYREIVLHQDPAVTLFGQLTISAWDESDISRRTVTVPFDAKKNATRAKARQDSTMRQKSVALSELLPMLGFTIVPFLVMLCAQVFFSGAFMFPILVAIASVIPWLGMSNIVANRFGKSFEFRLLAFCTGASAASFATLLPHWLVTGGTVSGIVSIVLLVCGIGSWIVMTNELEKEE